MTTTMRIETASERSSPQTGSARDAAMLRYRCLTPEQIEERRRKARIYTAKRREELNADQRRRYAARVARMTPEQRAILHEQ